MRSPEHDAATVDYDGPDESVGCAFPGCTNRLRRSNFGPSQFCSKAHRDGRRVYEFKTSESMSRDGWYIVKQRIASGSGGWEVVASVFGGRCAEIVRDALSKEANLDA